MSSFIEEMMQQIRIDSAQKTKLGEVGSYLSNENI